MSDWISVKDKLPDERVKIRLLLTESFNPNDVLGERLSSIRCDGTPYANIPWFHTEGGYWLGTESVTHWKPTSD